MLHSGRTGIGLHGIQRIDQDFERIERGWSVNVPADAPNATPKMTLARPCQFERDLTAEGKKKLLSKLRWAGSQLRTLFVKRSESTRQNYADDIRNFLVWLPTHSPPSW